MNTILGDLGKSQKFIDLLKQLENKQSPIEISGLTDVGMVQLSSAINEFTKKPICILTYNEIQAKKLYEDIRYFTDKVVFFPKKEIVTYDYIAESKDLPYKRIEALNQLQSKKNLIMVTTIEAAIQKLPQKRLLYKNKLKLKVGESYNLEEIKRKLIDLGYSRYELIEGRGQFSIRGGILDISIDENIGVRIEFWGDEIDSIRNFNIVNQRSIKTLEKAIIYPAHEYILENDVNEVCKKIEDKYKDEKVKEFIQEDIEQIKNGNYISKIDKYFDCFYENQETILEYLSENYEIFLDEIGKIQQRAKNIEIDNQNLIKTLIEKGRFVPEAISSLLDYGKIEELLNPTRMVYISKQDVESKINAEKYKFNYRTVNYYKSEIEGLFSDLHKYINEKKKIYLLVSTKEKAKKYRKYLKKKKLYVNMKKN